LRLRRQRIHVAASPPTRVQKTGQSCAQGAVKKLTDLSSQFFKKNDLAALGSTKTQPLPEGQKY
jgi:hypothetical protein